MTDKPITPHDYSPEILLNSILDRLKLRDDRALARRLNVAPCVLSRVRLHRGTISGLLLLKINEVTDIPVSELRHLMRDRRKRFRVAIEKTTMQ
jgi:hypothetical protein